MQWALPAAQSSSQQVVTATAFILTDGKGNVLAVLSSEETGSPYLSLTNGDATALLLVEPNKVAITTKVGSSMAAISVDGIGAAIGLTPDTGTGSKDITAAARKDAVYIRVDRDGEPHIFPGP